MDLKEYLMSNSEPIFGNEGNVFILLWLEQKGRATTLDIARTTNISVNDITKILNILYKNELVSIFEESYTITKQGIEILDALGYSDIQINNLLAQTEFKDTEYALYKDLFRIFRKNYLDIYLLIVQELAKEQEEFTKEFQIIDTIKNGLCISEYMTLWQVNLFHQMGHIVYTGEQSRLMSYYNKLYDFSYVNHCFSSERYHYGTSTLWSRSKRRDDINYFIARKLRGTTSNYFLKPPGENILKLKTYSLLDMSTDLELSHQIFNKESMLIHALFSSYSLQDLTQKLNLSEVQTRFVLKSLQCKINDLLIESENKD